MRLFILAVVLTVALSSFFVSPSGAVGLYAVGKEQISCSPLVARGIVPDTWNKLTEALLVPQISWALDKLAVEVKTVLSQFGAPPSNGVAETASVVKEDLFESKEKDKPKELNNSVIEKKTSKPTKSTKKTQLTKDKKIKTISDKPKKRIKVPPKAM